jgi:hypothetical protein
MQLIVGMLFAAAAVHGETDSNWKATICNEMQQCCSALSTQDLAHFECNATTASGHTETFTLFPGNYLPTPGRGSYKAMMLRVHLDLGGRYAL